MSWSETSLGTFMSSTPTDSDIGRRMRIRNQYISLSAPSARIQQELVAWPMQAPYNTAQSQSSNTLANDAGGEDAVIRAHSSSSSSFPPPGFSYPAVGTPSGDKLPHSYNSALIRSTHFAPERRIITSTQKELYAPNNTSYNILDNVDRTNRGFYTASDPRGPNRSMQPFFGNHLHAKEIGVSTPYSTDPSQDITRARIAVPDRKIYQFPTQ